MSNILVKIVAAALLFPMLAGAEEIPQPTPPEPDVFLAIERSKNELRSRLELREKSMTEPTIVTSKDATLDITLAVWNKKTDSLDFLEATKSKRTLNLKTPFHSKIKLVRDNGVNSRYEIEDQNYLIVATAHPTFKDVTVKKRDPMFELHYKIYTPYNEAFYKPAVLRKGSDYLSYLLKDAYDEVRANGIKSQTFRDQLLTDIVDPYLVKAIAIIEHTDGQIYSTDQPEQSVGRFLVMLALNGEDAYNFSVSSAGARGLVQFMPKTYAAISKKRPELGLIQDFPTAMSDHTNAIKAQMALLDENLDLMPKELQTRYLADRSRVAPFLAAAYNGGTVRVRRAFSTWGEEWLSYKMSELKTLQAKADEMDARMKQLGKLLKKTGLSAADKKKYRSELSKLEAERPIVRTTYRSIKKNALYSETRMYVEKLNRVYQMLAAGYFATPNAIDGTVATR